MVDTWTAASASVGYTYAAAAAAASGGCAAWPDTAKRDDRDKVFLFEETPIQL